MEGRVKSTLVYAVSATPEPQDRKDDLLLSPRSVRGSVLQIGLVVSILYSVNVLDFQRLEHNSCSIEPPADCLSQLQQGPSFLNFPSRALKRQVGRTLALPQPVH